MNATSTAPVRRLRPASPLPFVVLAAFALLQVVSPADAWAWALTALAVLLLVSYYWARLLRDHVTGSREVLGTWVIAGDELRERFVLTNSGWLPAIWARVRDHSGVPGYTAERVETVDGHGGRTWTFTGICRRRGVFRLGPWDLEMADPFGFFQVTQHYPVATTIMVYPRAAHLPDLELPRGTTSGRAASIERSPAETITIAELRAYQPGDSLRRIHWPATAHHGRLLVREFDREPTGDLWLVVDMDAAVQAGREAEATSEYAVILAASLASQLLRGGERRAVGLAVSGQTPAVLGPGRGPAQLWQILAALTEAEPDKPPVPFMPAQTGRRLQRLTKWRQRLACRLRANRHIPPLGLWSDPAAQDTHGDQRRYPAAGPGGPRPAPRQPLASILTTLAPTLGGGRTLVIVTPSQDPAWVAALLPLMARGNAPAVILLDATTFDPPCGSAEGLSGLRGLLAGQRIPVYVLAQGFPFAPIERLRRHRRILQTLPGTGRVIARDVEEEV